MVLESLTADNFLLFAAKHYDNVGFTTEEFYEDLKRIKYIKKLVTRYVESGELKERLILNHIIVLNNVFGAKALVRILFLKLEAQMRYVKPFLILLNILPEKVYGVGKNPVIHTDEIPMDAGIVKALRKV